MSSSGCGATFSPLQRFIHLGRYQTKTNELEKLVVEAASETNYRRAVQELARDGKLPISFHTSASTLVEKYFRLELGPERVGMPSANNGENRR